MKTTDKRTIRQLAALLPQFGVTHAVMSPGSRNAPLLVALERQPDIQTYIVIDERSAAFIALGMADAMSKPVALVCTSGTAPLNYSPAIAEAFYRNIPLIVITADRPSEWIDQDDSQTINQQRIYNNYIKGSFDIPVDNDDPDRIWYINRTLNDALALATNGRQGPVHINIRISEPLGNMIEVEREDIHKIDVISAPYIPVPTDLINELAREIHDSKNVLILAGFMPTNNLSEPLTRLADLHNVTVMCEAQSNLHSVDSPFIHNIDASLRIGGKNEYNPDLVITIGGSLTSRMIKTLLRNNPHLRHWCIGLNDRAVDCFKHLYKRLFFKPEQIIIPLAQILHPDPICKRLHPLKSASSEADKFANSAPWSDFKAMNYIINNLPAGYNLQLSNGTSVRYVQLFNYLHLGRIDCNRGVSGIDGCTSTAIGSAIGSGKPTVLISGDMSFQYDIGALATTFIPHDFKIIVLSNGGGGIFRFIPSTRHLDELDRCFAGPINLPLEPLAQAYGMKYYVARNYDELCDSFDKWIHYDTSPSILEIITDGDISANILRQFFSN